jgi:SNF2 family DNA or RNA helicase
MTPYEAVREEFDFPFELYPFQIERLNTQCEFTRGALYWQGGTGKTISLLHYALYFMLTSGVSRWVLPMPPILLDQWARLVAKVTHRGTGKVLTSLKLEGTLAKRKKMDLDVNFLLCSYGILKNDFDRIYAYYDGKQMGVAVDEGHAIKNTASLTHQAVKKLAEDRNFMALTATPITTPADSYAFIKLISPMVYRNQRQFDKLHVAEVDEYEKVTKWANLDLLADNMKIQTTRVLRRQVNKELPSVVINQVPYDLAPAHLALYRRIADEKLVEFDDGREINAISAQALRSALQQIVVNWGHFEEDPTRRPAALDLVDEVFGELEQHEKLVVVANFRRSNRFLLESLTKYKAVAVFGEVSPKGKQAAIAQFIEDDECRCIILQPQSAGYGVDGLQRVCSDMLFLEAPTTAPAFHQVVWRLDRDGQKDPVNCRVGVANSTVQGRLFRNLLENDAMINSVQGGLQDLRDSIYGH